MSRRPGLGPGRRLVGWFRKARRELPWRGPFPRDPYRVLVAETMLQQTQVARVVPAYERFLERFPSVDSLAAATVEEVVAAFSGLGYYRRARLLHDAARAVVRAGGWPRDPAGLRALPGIGEYTAAAVAAFAFGGSEPLVDGNVMRVTARLRGLTLASGGPALKREAFELGRALHAEAPSPEVFEGLMELGATICLPESPGCDACPLGDECAARATGDPSRFPLPRKVRAAEQQVWAVLWLRAPDGRVLLRRVSRGPILRGLFLPPLEIVAPNETAEAVARRLGRSTGYAGELQRLPAVRHTITHRRIAVVPFVGLARGEGVPAAESEKAAPPEEPGDGIGEWHDPRDPAVPTSSLLGKLLATCEPSAGRGMSALRAEARRRATVRRSTPTCSGVTTTPRKGERHGRNAR